MSNRWCIRSIRFNYNSYSEDEDAGCDDYMWQLLLFSNCVIAVVNILQGKWGKERETENALFKEEGKKQSESCDLG